MLHQAILSLANTAAISDYIVKEGDPLWVRKHGALSRVSDEVFSREHILDFLRKHEAHTCVATSKINQLLEEKGDLDFAVKLARRRFRGNLYWSNNKKLSLVLRGLHDLVPTLSSLGLPDTYLRLIEQSKGLLLVTGATGSGKTTTLAASLEHLNATRCGHIITLEDPVEYLLQSKRCLVDQRQIGRDAKSFPLGLRAAMRQDPDIILVGELRDYETVKTALDAANTGHLVMATLHTNSAQQSIDRLTSFFGAEKRDWAQATLSQALLGVISQVLLPRKDGSGRVLAAELLVCTPDVRASIRDGRTHQLFNAMDTGSSKGQVVLNTVLRQLIRDGSVSEKDAFFAAYDPNALRKDLKNG